MSAVAMDVDGGEEPAPPPPSPVRPKSIVAMPVLKPPRQSYYDEAATRRRWESCRRRPHAFPPSWKSILG